MRQERIVFMGTPEFAVATLKALVESGAQVVGVITAPDRKAGRGMKLQHSAVKTFALERGFRILQPTNLKSAEFLDALRELNATLQIVVAFRMLPEVVWNMPPKGTVNLHASLLPQYRGAAPINWAIINGEKKTGVTTFFLQQEIDTGNIIFQESVPIGPEENAGQLHDRLMVIGAELVIKTVKAITTGEQRSIPQSNTGSLRTAPKIFKETCRINWHQTIQEVHDHIRGLSPYPTAFTELVSDTDRTLLKIFCSKRSEMNQVGHPGQIRTENSRMFVRCSDGWLEILELQLAGKRPMPTSDLLRGTDLSHSTAE